MMCDIGRWRARTHPSRAGRGPALAAWSAHGEHTAPATRTDFDEELRRRITYRTGPRLRYAEPNRSEHRTRMSDPASAAHLSLSRSPTWVMAVTLSTLSSRARGPPGAPATAVVVFGVFGSGPLPFVPATSGLRPGTGGARSGTAGRAAAARAARPASPSQQHVAPWAVVPACCDRTARHTVTARPARGAHNRGERPGARGWTYQLGSRKTTEYHSFFWAVRFSARFSPRRPAPLRIAPHAGRGTLSLQSRDAPSWRPPDIDDDVLRLLPK